MYIYIYTIFFFSYGTTARNGPRSPHYSGFTITLRHTTLGRTPPEQVISLKQKPLPDNTQHSKQTSMTQAEFEPAIPASERPQTHALNSAATGVQVNILK